MEKMNKEMLLDALKKMIFDEESDDITKEEAKHIVSKMYHYEDNRKYVGEKYDMHTAEFVYNEHKHFMHKDTTVCDVYIAINSQYHDYCNLFKSWFGNSIDDRIFEAAITFWFKDVDFPESDKVEWYFVDEEEI